MLKAHNNHKGTKTRTKISSTKTITKNVKKTSRRMVKHKPYHTSQRSMSLTLAKLPPGFQHPSPNLPTKVQIVEVYVIIRFNISLFINITHKFLKSTI